MLLTNDLVKELGLFLLETINIPDEYTIISNFAFQDCQAKSIIINDNIEEIQDFAFLNCSNLEKIIIRNSVKKIGSFVFKNCKSIKMIAISQNVSVLNDGLFEGCINLERLIIFGVIQKIGKDIFKYCFNIKISINDSITENIKYDFLNDIKKNKNNFDRKISVCDIYNIVKTIKGLESSSASNTDTWILNFREETTYEDISISKGFFKIFLSDLVYEIQTYEKIMLLYNNNICTNFVKYLGSCMNCTSKDLMNFLKDKTILDDKNILENLNRNVVYMVNKFKNRPSIDKITLTLYKYILDNYKYNILLLEYVEPINFNKWIIINNRTLPNFELELRNILFQICVCFYSLSLSKIIHNDIHMGNIFIKKLPTETVSLYYINDEAYLIKSNYKPLIYDFDRAYVQSLGNNKYIEGREKYSITNFYIENKDIIKVFCYIYNIFPMYREYIINLVSKNETGKKIIKESYRLSPNYDPDIKKLCLLQYINKINDKIEPIPNEWYINFNSYEEIINNLYKSIPKFFIKEEDIDKSNIFYCNKNYFFEDGSINIEKLEIDKRKPILISYEPRRKKIKKEDGRRKNKSKRKKSKIKKRKSKSKRKLI